MVARFAQSFSFEGVRHEYLRPVFAPRPVDRALSDDLLWGALTMVEKDLGLVAKDLARAGAPRPWV
jgi:hypothetical protein